MALGHLKVSSSSTAYRARSHASLRSIADFYCEVCDTHPVFTDKETPSERLSDLSEACGGHPEELGSRLPLLSLVHFLLQQRACEWVPGRAFQI